MFDEVAVLHVEAPPEGLNCPATDQMSWMMSNLDSTVPARVQDVQCWVEEIVPETQREVVAQSMESSFLTQAFAW